MSIKQLFCKHIWKEISIEFLYNSREELVLSYYVMYSYYASHIKCIKCGKDNVIQTRIINI